MRPTSCFRASQAQRWASFLCAGLRTVWGPVRRSLEVSLSFVLLNACLLCVGGCHNTCVSGTLNSPSGSSLNVIVSNPPPFCTLSTANGLVKMEVGAAPRATVRPATGGGPAPFAHLFVTLSAVEARSSKVDGDDARGWQPLAELQTHPLQFDLLTDAPAPLPDTAVPAGVYREIRLRLAGEPPGDTAVENNHCSGGAPHCAVMVDGREWSLAFPSSSFDAWVGMEESPGGELYVPPAGTVILAIELDRDRSWGRSSGDSLLFYPVFRVRRVD